MVPPPIPQEQPRSPEPRRERRPDHPELKRAELKEFKTPLLELGVATLASAEHPTRNEDATAFYEQEDMAAVFDGAGGQAAGDIASRFARDNLISHVERARLLVEAMNATGQIDLWNKVVEGNSYVMADELEGEETRDKARLRARRERDVGEARAYFEKLNPPDDVKLEASALYLALQNLSDALQAEGKRRGTPDMATTATGVKLMEEPDGRRYGIFWSVGDSDAWLFREKTGEVIRPVRSDNGLDAMVGRGSMTPLEAENLSDPLVHQLRFSITGQALGPMERVIPHLMIYELDPGDRFLLASDGLGDNDLEGRFQKRLRTRTSEPWSKVVRDMTGSALEGIRNQEGKGWDDITVVAGEVSPIELGEEDIEIEAAE